jgi:ABC-type dipeptide/oligopeptide/nickel transport system permease subunit
MADSLLIIVGLLLGVALGYIVGRWAGYQTGWEDAMLHRAASDLYRVIGGDDE